MSVHPSARDKNLPINLPDEAESKGRHPLLYVPSFNARIQIVWEMLKLGGSSSRHHLVYIKRKEMIENESEGNTRGDKFAAFRSDGVNVHFEVDLPGSDGVAGNWVALRTDVLPWLTHINSTLVFPPQQGKKKSDSFPKLRSVALKSSVKEMKTVTWFEDEEDLDGLCLIFTTVNFNLTIDGRKEIILDGPVKAALLSVSGFNTIDYEDAILQDSIDLNFLDQSDSMFGSRQKRNNSGKNEKTPCRVEVETTPFLTLQELSRNIDELDYVVVTDRIDIRNQSMAKIISDCAEDVASINDVFGGVDGSWSILIARCRLLWTIAIRDSILAISKDLIYTVGFMKSQQRQMQLISGVNSGEGPIESEECEVFANSLAGVAGECQSRLKSMLEYLLEERFDADFTQPDYSRASANSGYDNIHDQNPTLPTLDIHFSNPQVQLHSTATGGSIIVAMESAHVETRKFVHLVVANLSSKVGNVSPSDLLIKTGKYY
jgi:hypothetical protein